MIGYFPKPYKDEICYSIVAGYHLHIGNISEKSTMNELLGRYVSINFEMPMGVYHLVKVIKIISEEYSEDYFLDNLQ